jgi:hypothetical protein
VNIALVNDQWISDAVSAKAGRKPSPMGAKFLQALLNVFASGVATTFQSWPAARITDWRYECRTMGLVDKDSPKSESALMSKYRLELITCDLIACNGDLVWIIK